MSSQVDNETRTIKLKEVLPKQGQVHMEYEHNYILCKPKMLPLKSASLRKMEDVQKKAQDAVKAHMDWMERFQASESDSGSTF